MADEQKTAEMWAALIERLQDSQARIARMCSEARPPKMSIPADPVRDDDLVICAAIRDAIAALRQPPASEARPVDMLLFCPKCGTQHVDAPDGKGWDNPPHRSHLCHACGCVWRPADVPTNGVAEIKTKGSVDNHPAKPSTPTAGDRPTVIVNVFKGEWINCMFTDEVRVLMIDESSPRDRVYELTITSTPEEIAKAIGDSPVGNDRDGMLTESQRRGIIAAEARERGETLVLVKAEDSDQ